MLQYLAEHPLKNLGSPVKDYKLAPEGFGRPSTSIPISTPPFEFRLGDSAQSCWNTTARWERMIRLGSSCPKVRTRLRSTCERLKTLPPRKQKSYQPLAGRNLLPKKQFAIW